MFEEFKFSEKQIKKYFEAAFTDLGNAKEINIPSVRFRVCYDILLKLAITVCAKNGMRVRARKGHHIELILKLSDLLGYEDIERIGDEMRIKRNTDLYSGGIVITEKEAEKYLGWVEEVFHKTERYLFGGEKLF